MREIRKNREKARRRIIGFESPLARWIDGFPSSSIVSRERKGKKEKKREKREKKKTAVRERTRKPAASPGENDSKKRRSARGETVREKEANECRGVRIRGDVAANIPNERLCLPLRSPPTS